MRLSTSKSKNAESFYITQGYIDDEGKSTSKIVKKLGTLKELLKEHGPTREDVVKWAREEAKKETEKYKNEKERLTVPILFHTKQTIPKGKQVLFSGGYLFLQSIYYRLEINKICRKLRDKYKFDYDINAILSDLIYARVLEPSSKRSSFSYAQHFLEKPTYQLHDVYRALDVLGKEADFIQSEVYKNSKISGKRNDQILYYDCTNYYFEIEQEDGDKKYGKSKEHRPNPILQMGLFMDGDGIPLAFSLFPGNSNEQNSLKPLEEKVLSDFGCQKFIYCSDAGLGSERIRNFNHMGKRAFIVTQSIKKLNAEDKEWALDKTGYRRILDNKLVDITKLSEDDTGVYYKEEPYTPKELHQRLIVTYSPKFARYQKMLREKQWNRAEIMAENGKHKKERRNPNDPARFIDKIAVTKEGEKAEIKAVLNVSKAEEESLYDGLYAVSTDLLEDDINEILKVSEGRWKIEECFRIMKTEFEARPIYLQTENRIKAHFLTCFLALIHYRYLEKDLKYNYTCENILETLRNMNFAEIQEQGFIPLYERTELTDELHNIYGFQTDYTFLTKSQMKNIQKLSKNRKNT